jgi:hypothetical protein
VLNLIRPRGRLANHCVPSTVGMLCPAAPSMTVPTVVMMPKKKTARGNSRKRKRQATIQTAAPVTNELVIDAGYTYPKQCIDELLKLAGDSSPQSRCDLLNALQLAQLAYDVEQEDRSHRRPPPKQIKQLEASIEKTRTLLRSIRKYDDWRNIGFVTQQVGRGVVAAAAQELPLNPTISDQELILPHFDGKAVRINIEPLLRATPLYARRRRRGRGNRKWGKEAVVFYAEGYFRRYSPKKPSRDPKNPFHEFAQRFYEVVTKTEPGSLDRQMRSVFAARRSGR